MRQIHTPFRRAAAGVLLVPFLATLPGAPTAAEVVGEQVVSGDVSIDRAGDVTTIHASDGAIIEYERFSVWSNEELHFVQPDSQSRVMNRVLGDPTQIDGGLYANGIVYIVNPAGIFFGANAVVDVGGLYAAAGNVSNEDFLAGLDRFELTGVVENAGRIESPEVALLGRAVANHGEIHAPDGTIALVAGERVVLTRLAGRLHVEVDGAAGSPDAPAIAQTGTLDAGDEGSVSFTTGDVYSLAVNHEGITRGGRIELRAATGLLQVAGLLDASDTTPGGTGGEISVTGGQVALLGALLDASGDAGGGTIRVGGDLRGQGSLPNATRTYVDGESVLRADAATSGDGGTVIVYADEATAFHGAISARGGAEGGDGGFAEISGAVFLFSGGDVDLRAVQGANGTLLYDPKDIVIAGGVADGDDDPDAQSDRLEMASLGQVLFAEPDELASPFTIHESEIEGTQADVVLEATNSITSTGAGTFTNDGGEGVDVLRIADGFSVTMRTRNLAGDETGGFADAGIDLDGISIQTSGGGAILLETGFGDPTTAPDPTPGLGGDIVVGDLTTTGAAGAAGGDVTLSITGAGSIGAGAIDTRGGASTDAAGGAGGAVSLTTEDGAISVASIDSGGGATTSADPAHAGGAAGSIALRAGDADPVDDSDVSVSGALSAIGGDASAGDGGAGGAILVTSTGVATPLAVAPDEEADIDPLAGGGDLDVADVTTRGGAGGASGGAGGAVTLQTTDGAIDVASIDTSGGAGGVDGGDAGSIALDARDADQSGQASADNDVSTGALVAAGGSGGTGVGGRGGSVRVDTRRAQRVRNVAAGAEPDDLLQEELGGGSIVVASIDTRGGAGDAGGGRAGSVALRARGDGKGVTVVGAVTATGGAAGSGEDASGGAGAPAPFGAAAGVAIGTDDGAISVGGTIDVSGGDTASVDPDPDESGGNGGSAGSISLVAVDADDTGDSHVTVNGDLVALGGTAVEGSGGQGGSVSVRAEGAQTPLPVPDPPDDMGFDPSSDPFRGGGDLELENVWTGGGDGGGEGRGGAGGRVSIGSTVGDQVISVGDVDTTGGSAGVSGGRGGDVFLFTQDSDGLNDNSITVGALRTAGGSATAEDGRGGGGGAVEMQTFARPEVTQAGDPETIHQEAIGGGSVTLESIDASGGDGAFGGSGGRAILVVRGAGQTVEILDGATGIQVGGGDSTAAADTLGAAGLGGVVQIAHQAETLLVDYTIDATGGDAPTGMDGTAGIGGVVVLQTGFEDDDPAADLIVTALPDARGGSNPDGSRALSRQRAMTFNSTGRTEIDVGPLALSGNLEVNADGGFVLRGTLDAADDATDPVSFVGVVGGASILEGDIGATRPLDQFVLLAAEDAVDPTTRFEGSSITTLDRLLHQPAMTVVGDTTFDAGGGLTIGAIDADPAAASSNLAFVAGDFVQFTGDIGSAQVVTALDVDASEIAFDGSGTQRVDVGAGGIRLGADISSEPVAPSATIGRLSDGLHLETTGDLLLGDGQKLSVPGSLTLVGDLVRVTDLSALDLGVQANTFEVFARGEGAVLLPSGAQTTDFGTDILANTVSFSAAPAIVGGGAAPRIATLSGTAEGAGGLQVTRLERPIAASDIASELAIFDLAIPTPDPGLETPERPVEDVEVPLGLYPSEDASASDTMTSSAEVVAYLACAPVGGRDAPSGCTPTATPRDGSALDTERAQEVAADWRWLLGPSKRAEAGRDALARTGGDPASSLADTSPAGRAWLARAARLLAQLRMLGLGAGRYGEVRASLLGELVEAIGSPEVGPERLFAAVEAYAMGMEI